MSDEPTKDKAKDTDTSPAKDGNDGLNLTQEELDEMMGERARRAERAAKASILEELGLESVDDLKKTVTAYREKQKAEMSELEKAQAKLEKAQTERDSLQQQMRDMQIRSAVQAKAQDMNFHNPARAYDLMDREGLVLEDGKVTGVGDALKALVEAEPYLVKDKKAPDIDARKKGKGTKEPDESEKEGIYRRFGIRV